MQEWERRRRLAELTSVLLEKEEKLRVLRDGSRVTLREMDFPEDELDEEVRLTARLKTCESFGNIFNELTSTVFATLCRGS